MWQNDEKEEEQFFFFKMKTPYADKPFSQEKKKKKVSRTEKTDKLLFWI